MLIRVFALLLSIGLALTIAVLPSEFIHYAVPFADHWYHTLTPARQETVQWLLQRVVPVVGIAAVVTGLVQMARSMRKSQQK